MVADTVATDTVATDVGAGPTRETGGAVVGRLLPRAGPESQGVSSGALRRLVDALDEPRLGLHSLVVVRHGSVVAEGWWRPYRADTAHSVFSVSKSLTATAVGMAVADGRLSVDERVLDILPSYATATARANAGHLTVRHLLTMASGHAADTMPTMRALPGADWVRIFLETPCEYPPGERFVYDNGASHLLAVIVASRTGQGLVDYLTPRLFEPLAIDTPVWATNARGVCLGSTGLRLTTDDLAKIGQLFLQHGRWQGRQLIDESWLDQASRAQISTRREPEPDRALGYGFQFWSSRHGGYRADGAYGQHVLVMPGHDAVVAVTAGTSADQDVLAAPWDHLLPGLATGALDADPGGEADLVQRLRDLEMTVPPVLSADPPSAETLAGQPIRLPFNTLGVTTVTLAFGDDTVTMTLTGEGTPVESVTAGRDRWLPGHSRRWPDDELTEVATANRAGWSDDRTLDVHQQCLDTAFRRSWRFRLTGTGSVEVEVGLDLPFWTPRTERLTGHLDHPGPDR